MSLFHLSEVPHITFFGNKLNSKEALSDQEVFVCFMQIVVSCFLCPSTGDSLDTKYIEQLGDPERARRFDTCLLAYNHLMHGVTKTVKCIKAKGRKPKFFEFCSYALGVYYLDCLDFGVHIAGSGVPRSVSWRGDMIKIYSELDCKGRKGFGRRRMRKDLASCYSHGATIANKSCAKCGSRYEELSAREKQNMHEQFGMVLSGKTIDDILDIVQCFHSSESGNNSKPDMLVHDILQLLVQARPWYNSGNHIQKDGVHSSFANLSVSNGRPASYKEETPVSFANKIVDKNSIITAPELPPVAKVKSRLSVKLPESCQQGICQADLISPISRINLSPFSRTKDGSKMDANHLVSNLFAKSHKGSQQVPIPIGDATPKTILADKSPEVTITGISSFKDRQNELAMDTDAVYNRSVHAKAPPAIHSVRKDYAIIYHGVHCSYISLGQALMMDGHIDNFLIPCFCRKLFEDKHPSKSGRHYFFSYIGESILKYTSSHDKSLVRTSFPGAASASRGKRLELSDRLFFSICHEDHWFTFCVDFKWKLYAFLDSFYGPESQYQRSVQDRLRTNFEILWKNIFQTDEIYFKEFKVMNANLPRQGNPHDCGVMTMMAMEFFDPVQDLCKRFSKDDVPHIRIQYANRLFFHNGNKADRSLVTNFYDKACFHSKGYIDSVFGGSFSGMHSEANKYGTTPHLPAFVSPQ